MDERRLKAADVHEALHVSEQSILNWRASGVPARRVPHVKKFMAEWVDPALDEAAKPSLDALRSEGVQNLILHPTEDQFNNWTAAFKASKYPTFHDWAVAGLEVFAREEEQQKTIAFPPADRKRVDPTLTERISRRGNIAAGGKITVDQVEEEMPVAKKYPKGHYALSVTGKSMEPQIPNGSTVIVKQWKDGYPKKGSIVVYSDGHGATLKVYDSQSVPDPDHPGHKLRSHFLRSLNPESATVEVIEGGKIDAVLVEVL